MNLTVKDVKMFVPAQDFKESLRFYQALGCQLNWLAEDNSLAILELAGCRFYLQDFYNKDLANNYMIHISVEDSRAWWEHASKVIADGNYKNVRLTKPKEEPYGAIVTFIWDPSGVLLHMAQFL